MGGRVSEAMQVLATIESCGKTSEVAHELSSIRLSVSASCQCVSLNELHINDFAGWEQAFAWLKKLAENLFRIAGENSSDKGRQLAASIQNYVQGHLGEDLSLTVIANYVNYNESHVSRLFKRITGDNLTEYITAQRIAYARQLLERTDDTVQVISKKAGFHTSQYFSSAFRKSMGVSPNEYRLQNRRT